MSCSSCKHAREAFAARRYKEGLKHTAKAVHNNYVKPMANKISGGKYVRKEKGK